MQATNHGKGRQGSSGAHGQKETRNLLGSWSKVDQEALGFVVKSRPGSSGVHGQN